MSFDPSKIKSASEFSADYQVPWMFEGLMEWGGMNMLFGSSRARKSTLASYLVACAVFGAPAFGHYRLVRAPKKVLMLYGEGRLEAEMARLHKVTSSLGHRPEELAGKIWTAGKDNGVRLDTPEDIRALARYVQVNDIELLTVDALANFHGQDENANGAMAMISRNLAQCTLGGQCAVLLNHHMGKPQADQPARTIGQSARGATSLPANMDNNMQLIRKKGTEHDLLLEDKYGSESPQVTIKINYDTWLWELVTSQSEDADLDKRLRELKTANPTLSKNALSVLAGGRRNHVLERLNAIENE